MWHTHFQTTAMNANFEHPSCVWSVSCWLRPMDKCLLWAWWKNQWDEPYTAMQAVSFQGQNYDKRLLKTETDIIVNKAFFSCSFMLPISHSNVTPEKNLFLKCRFQSLEGSRLPFVIKSLPPTPANWDLCRVSDIAKAIVLVQKGAISELWKSNCNKAQLELLNIAIKLQKIWILVEFPKCAIRELGSAIESATGMSPTHLPRPFLGGVLAFFGAFFHLWTLRNHPNSRCLPHLFAGLGMGLPMMPLISLAKALATAFSAPPLISMLAHSSSGASKICCWLRSLHVFLAKVILSFTSSSV